MRSPLPCRCDVDVPLDSFVFLFFYMVKESESETEPRYVPKLPRSPIFGVFPAVALKRPSNQE